MKPPVEFTTRLNHLFDHRLRCRWSHQRDEWHIEAKVAPGQVLNCVVKDNDDDALRAQDGYAYVMSIRTGDRMPCPRCSHEVEVPIFKIGDIVCSYCKMQGQQAHITAAYFPLESDALTQHLIRFDPLRSYRDTIAKDADAHNAAVAKQKEKEFDWNTKSAILDDYRRLVGIPTVGYTGKEQYPQTRG